MKEKLKFDPSNRKHLEAYYHLHNLGIWPEDAYFQESVIEITHIIAIYFLVKELKND